MFYHQVTFFLTLLLCASLSSGAPRAARRIGLPLGVRAEGVAHVSGSNFIASDINTGNIYLLDVFSGLITTVVRSPPNRAVAGVFATRRHIFAAGTGSFGGGRTKASLHVYETVTGQTVVSCDIAKGVFVNDVTATKTDAYYTDSGRPVVYHLPLAEAMKGRCTVTEIPLPPTVFGGVPGAFYANGIRGFNNGLLIVNSFQQTIYFHSLKSSKTIPVLPPRSLPNADGITVVRRPNSGASGAAWLYVAQNRLNTISVWDIRPTTDDDSVRVRFVRNITSAEFVTPTTVAVSKNRLVAANFDFNSPFVPSNQTFSVAFVRL